MESGASITHGTGASDGTSGTMLPPIGQEVALPSADLKQIEDDMHAMQGQSQAQVPPSHREQGGVAAAE